MHTDSMKVQLVAKTNWCRLTSDGVAARGLRSCWRWRGPGARPDRQLLCTGRSSVDACVRCTCVPSTCAQMALDPVFTAASARCQRYCDGAVPRLSSPERVQRAAVAAGHAVRGTV